MRKLRLSVCIEMIFNNVPFAERLDLVADSGIGAFEFWRWDNKDIPAIAERAKALGLRCAALVGSSAGPLVDPERRGDFLLGLRGGVDAARMLGASTLIVTTGQAMVDVDRNRQRASIVKGLRAAEPIARDAGLVLALEPLNTLIDHPGYYLDSTREGLEIVAEIGSPWVRLLYDIYHAQVMEGNLTRTLIDNLDQFAHVHVADSPGRHEPGTGEISYRHLFAELQRADYDGFVGLEYRPVGDHSAAVESTIAMARS